MIESRRIIKFGARVRDIDRQYEINNNADLDNGVYHKIEEEEKKEEQAVDKEESSNEEIEVEESTAQLDEEE
jgi:hypothetical protein